MCQNYLQYLDNDLNAKEMNWLSKNVLTPKDMFSLQNLTDAQISPDGKKVVYVVQEASLDEDKSKNSIWLLRLDGEHKPIRLTRHAADASPRWAPDSERIAFTSGRDEKAQLYIINVNGGEAEHIKTEKSPASSPLWSPDGKTIAFKSIVDKKPGPRYAGEPEELAPKAQDEKNHDKQKDKKDKVHVITDINYHADGLGMIYDKYPQIFTVDVEDKTCKQITERDERIGDFIWNRKGTSLIYLVNEYTIERARSTSIVRQVDVDNKADSKLLDFDGSLGRVDLAPNGRWLMLSGVDNSCPQGTGESMLWVVDLEGQSLPLDFSKAINLTAGQGASCMNAHWDHTGNSVYFIKHIHGATQLCQVLFSGQPETARPIVLPITKLSMISHYDMSQDGTIVFIASNFTTPPQVYLRRKEGAKQLTELNKDFLQKYELCPAEKYTYKGADGWDVEGWLVRPLNYEEGRRYPAVLSIHGGPTGAYYDSFQFYMQLLAHQGFAVVFTNPRGSVTYGAEFAQGCVNDLGGKDFEDIMAGLDKAIELGVVDPNRVGVMGWSYGGFMTCWTVTQTDRFKAAIGGANISNWYTLYGCSDSHSYAEGLWNGVAFDEEEKVMKHSPMRHVRNVKTPIMLLHGESDIRCPIDQSEQFYTALKRLGKEVVFVRYPGQYHGIVKPTYVLDRWLRTVGWFQHYLMES